MTSPASYLTDAVAVLAGELREGLVEIVINPDNAIWVEHRGDAAMRRSTLRLSTDQIHNLVHSIANAARAQWSEQKPVYSVSVPVDRWQVRVQALRAPAIGSGYAVAMRFYDPNAPIMAPSFLFGKPVSWSKRRAERNAKLQELAASGDVRATLKFCVTQKLNTVISGGTSSGKTQIARFLQRYIPDEERIITIEDAPDLMPTQPNRVMMISKADDPHRSPDALLQACLRMRPDRIVLSEIRGPEANTFLKAINTGHGGSITTLHADTAEMAIDRMAQAALEGPAGMEFHALRDAIEKSVDVVIHTAKIEDRRGIVDLYLPGQHPSKPTR